MNRYEAVRLGSVGAIIAYIGYQIYQEQRAQLADAGEIETVLGGLSYYVGFVIDTVWLVATEPVLAVLSAVYLLLVWPSVQPPY